MPDMDSQLITGSRGWHYPGWVPEFYPDDMPEDWWFSFYSNEFRAVLIPEAVLLAASEDTVEEWLDDADNNYVFFVEIITPANWPGLKSGISLLGEKVSAFVLEFPLDRSGADLAAELLPELSKLAPVCVRTPKSAVPYSDYQHLFKKYRVGSYWNIDDGRPQWDVSDLSIATVGPSQVNAMDARQHRNMIESVLSEMKGQQICSLIFESNRYNAKGADLDRDEKEIPPPVGKMRQVAMICELLG